MFYNVIMLMVLVQNSGYLNEIGCVSIKNLNKFLAMTCYPCGRPRLNDFGSTTKPTFWFNASVVTPQIFSKCQNLQSLVSPLYRFRAVAVVQSMLTHPTTFRIFLFLDQYSTYAPPPPLYLMSIKYKVRSSTFYNNIYNFVSVIFRLEFGS